MKKKVGFIGLGIFNEPKICPLGKPIYVFTWNQRPFGYEFHIEIGFHSSVCPIYSTWKNDR